MPAHTPISVLYITISAGTPNLRHDQVRAREPCTISVTEA
jgi:hypothetical protein